MWTPEQRPLLNNSVVENVPWIWAEIYFIVCLLTNKCEYLTCLHAKIVIEPVFRTKDGSKCTGNPWKRSCDTQTCWHTSTSSICHYSRSQKHAFFRWLYPVLLPWFYPKSCVCGGYMPILVLVMWRIFVCVCVWVWCIPTWYQTVFWSRLILCIHTSGMQCCVILRIFQNVLTKCPLHYLWCFYLP